MIFAHILLFALSAAVIWFLSGILIDATDRVAKRYKKPGFAVAFFVLGFLTSIGEISVAVNASIEGVPQVSAGNLMGASLVIFLLIIPLLAVLGNGVQMFRAMTPLNLALLLAIVILPALLTLDGSVTATEGLVTLLLYVALLFRIQKKRSTEETMKDALKRTERALLHTKHATYIDIGKIVVGAILIFVAGNILVEESVFFASQLSIPVSYVGLLVLSIGTNIPEIVIAIRCVLGRHKDIAFGDYMGSAVANTLIFGILALWNTSFTIEKTESFITFPLLTLGVILFFLFSRTKNNLSRKEGLIMLGLYGAFVIIQITNAVRLSDESGSLRGAAQEVKAIESQR